MDKDVTEKLFTSDLAIEIRSEFYRALDEGADVTSATAKLIDRYRAVLADPNDGPVVIICIAALQLERGELAETFRDAAIELIDSGEAHRAWRLDSLAARDDRRAVLDAIANELRTANVSS